MVGMAGNTNMTTGAGNDIGPLATPITPDNAAE